MKTQSFSNMQLAFHKIGVKVRTTTPRKQWPRMPRIKSVAVDCTNGFPGWSVTR